MATPRDVRRLALVALFQLDANDAESPELVREVLDDAESLAEEGLDFIDEHRGFRETDKDRAFQLALNAYEHRAEADQAMLTLAPEWPAGRQAAIDRAILRLAHYEITHTDHPPKAAVNEAIELAKAFSTEKSPNFINGLLGKFLKDFLSTAKESDQPAAESEPIESTEPAT